MKLRNPDLIDGLEDVLWTDEQLLETASQYPGVGMDAGRPMLERFKAGVSRLVGKNRSIRARLGAPPSSDASLCVFLFHPKPPPRKIIAQCRRSPMLDQGREELERKIWFVNHAVAVGTAYKVDATDDEEWFQLVEKLGLGNSPAILYDPRPPYAEMRFYPHGMNEPEHYDLVHIAHTEVTVDDIFARIDAIARKRLVTPLMQKKYAGFSLWADSKRGWSASDAEKNVGRLLSFALQGAFPTCDVSIEQPQPAGRLDVEIEEPIFGEPGGVRRHAILELKVLRGRDSAGRSVSERKTSSQIEEGVTQAAAYRSERLALVAALCCFDMRQQYTGRRCFNFVSRQAAALCVELGVWHLFSTAKAYRRHRVTLDSLGAGDPKTRGESR